MCSVIMDTEEGTLDYGLWDRTLMEVDLQLDSESFRHDFDYFARGPFYESDPLLPLIGNSEEDVCQLINALSRSSRDRNSCIEHFNLANADLDLSEGSHTSGSGEQSPNECLSPFLAPGIVIKTEPCDGQQWIGHDFADSDNSSTTSGGSRRSISQNGGKKFLPPTPPSSDGDGEGLHHAVTVSRGGTSSLSIATAISTSLATAEDGSIMLTEEEKRTLIAEGYPIPSRLPLTKAEERSLKRIRRKIKNKISAQESRRKKKEYIESLEKKVKNLNEDNADLRRRLESSESANRSLADQMSKYQTLLKGKVQVTPVRRAVVVQAEKSS